MRKGRRPLIVDGQTKGTRLFLHLCLVKGNREATFKLLEKVINRLDSAGFKYKAAAGKKNSVAVTTMYGQLEVTFVLLVTGPGELAGTINVSKPRCRSIGGIVAGKQIHIMTDIGDDVPSMTLDM